MFKKSKLLLATTLLFAGTANAGYEFHMHNKSKLTFGGYIKADARYVSGDVAYTDYWAGSGTALPEKKNNFGVNARETRFNTRYDHGNVTGFIEMDFMGDIPNGNAGNEITSNSATATLRHAFLQYKNLLIGQTWSTFQNTTAIPETADYGGALLATAFIRQSQVRLSFNGLDISFENPETENGVEGNDEFPDVIAKYTYQSSWGNIAVSALGRELQISEDQQEFAYGFGASGSINTWGMDDLKFQYHTGNVGRYVGVSAINDFAEDPETFEQAPEESVSYMVAYRHFWTKQVRSTAFYGHTTTEFTDRDRTQWGVNVFSNLTPDLSLGLEAGMFEIEDQYVDSSYVQFTAKYVL